MGNIESVMQETRVFPPSAQFVKQANVSGMDAYNALCSEAEKDFTGFWGRLGARERQLVQALHSGPRRVERSLLQVVPRR